MKSDEFEDLMAKAHSLIVDLLRQNLTLRILIKNSWPDDARQQISQAMSDKSTQQVVTNRLSEVLKDGWELSDLIHSVRSSREEEIDFQKPSAKPN
jgi:hypothetical protein